jgi:hypothetical protein
MSEMSQANLDSSEKTSESGLFPNHFFTEKIANQITTQIKNRSEKQTDSFSPLSLSPMEKSLTTFWKNILSDYSALSLPQKNISANNHPQKTFKTIAFDFDASISQSMYEFSRQYNSNLFCFFYLNIIEILSALTEKQDIGITTLVYASNPTKNNSCSHSSEPTVNINNNNDKLNQQSTSPLLLRYKLNPKLAFCEQFNQASLSVLQAYEHKDSNLEVLLKQLNLSSPDLFQIMISISDQHHRNMIYLPCKEFLTIPFPNHHDEADISFSLQYTEEGIQGELRYNESRYETDFIEKLLSFFQKKSVENLQYFDK